jgi:aminocarboxymuconate-semialdehyde decarboxylase
MIVDAHSHFVPPALLTTLERGGSNCGVGLQSGAGSEKRVVFGSGMVLRPFFPELIDINLHLEEMDRNGIDFRVVSPWLDLSGYWLPPDQGEWLCAVQNDALAETLEPYSDRFAGLACVPLQDGVSAARELHRAVGELGLRGVMIGSHVNEANLDEPELEPFWEAAEALQTFILLHPFQIFTGRRLSRYYMHNVIGNPYETSVAGSSLIFGGVLARHPGLRVCLSHAGGFLPYQIGRLVRAWEALPVARERLDRSPDSFLSQFYYDSISFDVMSLSFLISRVGAERVLLGSDFPFGMGDPQYHSRAQALEGLNKGEREAILGATASRLMNLDELRGPGKQTGRDKCPQR